MSGSYSLPLVSGPTPSNSSDLSLPSRTVYSEPSRLQRLCHRILHDSALLMSTFSCKLSD